MPFPRRHCATRHQTAAAAEEGLPHIGPHEVRAMKRARWLDTVRCTTVLHIQLDSNDRTLASGTVCTVCFRSAQCLPVSHPAVGWSYSATHMIRRTHQERPYIYVICGRSSVTPGTLFLLVTPSRMPSQYRHPRHYQHHSSPPAPSSASTRSDSGRTYAPCHCSHLLPRKAPPPVQRPRTTSKYDSPS